MALCAVTYETDIGVDIEQVENNNIPSELIETVFTKRELQTFKALKEEKKPKAFDDRWTCKEAYLKAIGMGLTLPPKRVEGMISSPHGSPA